MPIAVLVARCNTKYIGGVCLATLKPENGLLERKAIQAALDLVGGSYSKAGRNLGINRGTLYAIMNGKRHASNSVRAALGMPQHSVTVEPLPCGHAELVKRCPICKPRSTTPNATRKRDKRIEAMRAAVKLQQSIYFQS